MKLLVAGGAGYIGSALIPKLFERGYDVVVIDTLWFGNNLPRDVHVIKKDVFELKEPQLRGFDQVIFLAGLSNDPMAEFSPCKNFIYNAAAPAYLGYIAKRSGIKRFIFAGSCSVYGYTLDELYDETKPAVSGYPYSISKLQGEQSLLQFADDTFSVISLRKGTVSGYSSRMRLDLIVNTMFRTAVERGEIVINNPAIWRPILSIQDAVSAYIRAVEADLAISGIFNVASGNYTVGEVGDLVREAVDRHFGGSTKLRVLNIQDYRNYKVDYSKAIKVLGFRPKDGVEDIVEDLVDHMDQFKDFSNPVYYNIEVMKQMEDHMDQFKDFSNPVYYNVEVMKQMKGSLV